MQPQLSLCILHKLPSLFLTLQITNFINFSLFMKWVSRRVTKGILCNEYMLECFFFFFLELFHNTRKVMVTCGIYISHPSVNFKARVKKRNTSIKEFSYSSKCTFSPFVCVCVCVCETLSLSGLWVFGSASKERPTNFSNKKVSKSINSWWEWLLPMRWCHSNFPNSWNFFW